MQVLTIQQNKTPAAATFCPWTSDLKSHVISSVTIKFAFKVAINNILLAMRCNVHIFFCNVSASASLKQVIIANCRRHCTGCISADGSSQYERQFKGHLNIFKPPNRHSVRRPPYNLDLIRPGNGHSLYFSAL